MGEYAEMMLDGTCCSCCGEFLGSDAGYPVTCAGCGGDEEDADHQPARKKTKSQKTACPFCERTVAQIGLAQHIKDKHGNQPSPKDALAVASEAYFMLCKVPHASAFRIASDKTRAHLRDYIAAATGRTEEDVQNDFEGRAANET